MATNDPVLNALIKRLNISSHLPISEPSADRLHMLSQQLDVWNMSRSETCHPDIYTPSDALARALLFLFENQLEKQTAIAPSGKGFQAGDNIFVFEVNDFEFAFVKTPLSEEGELCKSLVGLIHNHKLYDFRDAIHEVIEPAHKDHFYTAALSLIEKENLAGPLLASREKRLLEQLTPKAHSNHLAKPRGL